MGLGRFELPTPRLSSVCSNQLSYRPEPVLSKLDRTINVKQRITWPNIHVMKPSTRSILSLKKL
uniref:Uncharacterized protein n=1 Tax=uncultured Acidobacteriales bacterium HF0200_23L05 TaxID=710732 RepID=E0XUM0_9BACT|nr:hypothetical protein [uncultured Acidobacteriales bacterium HF0200_23L05]